MRFGSLALGVLLVFACGNDDDPGGQPSTPSGGASGAGGSGPKEPQGGGGESDGGDPSNGEAGAPDGQAGESSAQAGAGSDSGGGGDSTGPVAKILIEPGGVLLTPEAPSQRLVAVAYDANGNVVDTEIQWSTNDSDSVTVDAGGLARAKKPLGSALLTATAGDAKATVFALAAKPVEGAVLLSDADITAGPVAEDASAPFSAGYRYTVELSVDAPAIGSLLLTSGDKPVAGRVVAVAGASVTLEQVEIDEVFEEIELDETLRLEDAPAESAPAPVRAFEVGPFDCESEGGVVGIEFAKNEHRALGLDSLTYEVVWNRERKKIEVRGKPGVAFEFEPTLAAALQLSVECKVILKEYQIPIPGPAKLFLGAAVVVGAGVELGGKIPVAGVGLNLKGEVSADLAMGAACEVGADCATLQEISTDASVTPTLVAPEVSVKFEPEAQAFVYAEFEGGARFTSTLRTEAIAAQAGFKLAGSFATEETQVAETDYASKYELTFEAEIGPGEAVDDFFNLIGFGLSFLKFEKSEPIASSPIGKVRASVSDFETGDEVTFTITLDPSSVEFPLFGYNVERVRVYRRETREDGSTALILANEEVAEAGQTRFVIPWVATIDGSIGSDFPAFVTTSLISLPLEIGAAEGVPRTGQLTFPTGDTLGANDSYVVVFPPDAAANPTGNPLSVARIYYSPLPDGILVCSKRRLTGGMPYITVNFAAENELAPGTYSYDDWSDNIVQPGTFFASISTQQACVDTELGPICECLPSDHAPFSGGELSLTESDGVLDGSFTLSSVEGPFTGTFTVPVCPKTEEEHVDIADGVGFECVPPPTL